MERNDSGQFAETVTLDVVLGVFDQVEGPVLTSGDVAEKTGCSQESARRKLGQMHEQGRVGRRNTAGRIIYWRLDAADPRAVDSDDSIFNHRPSFVSGVDNLSEQVDELLYGNGE